MADKFSRGEFLRRFLKPVVSSHTENTDQIEPDYLSMLPPEFNDTILKAEIMRLGGDPEKLTKNQMAGMVLGAMSNLARERAQDTNKS